MLSSLACSPLCRAVSDLVLLCRLRSSRCVISFWCCSGRAGTAQVTDMGIHEVLSTPRSPWQRAYVERVIGSIRREGLDHAIVFHETSLRRTLISYFDYYHRSRTHLSLGKGSPQPRSIQPPEMGRVVAVPQVGGLHRRYQRSARLKSPNIAPSEPVSESDPNCAHVRTRLPAHSVAESNRCRELLKLVCLLPEVTFIPDHTEFPLGTANRNVCRRTESVEEDRFGPAPCPPVLDRKSRAHAIDGGDSPSALNEHLA